MSVVPWGTTDIASHNYRSSTLERLGRQRKDCHMVKTQWGALLAVVTLSLIVSGALHIAMTRVPANAAVPAVVSAETTASIPQEP